MEYKQALIFAVRKKVAVQCRDRQIIGFTDLVNRYRLIGIDTHHIGIGIIGIGISMV